MTLRSVQSIFLLSTQTTEMERVGRYSGKELINQKNVDLHQQTPVCDTFVSLLGDKIN